MAFRTERAWPENDIGRVGRAGHGRADGLPIGEFGDVDQFAIVSLWKGMQVKNKEIKYGRGSLLTRSVPSQPCHQHMSIR
jgi:hypothetical protein